MRVGVLEDDREVSRGIARILERAGHQSSLYSRSEELVRDASRGACPPVVLCDLDLGGGETAMDAAAQVLEHAPDTQLVALTGHAGDAWVFPALSAGFVGYVLKSEAFDRLAEAVDEVAAGGAPLSRDVARRVLRAASQHPPRPATHDAAVELSRREIEVLELLADGYRYDQIALHLAISLGSVRTYVQRLYAKLGVSTKSEATAVALRRGLLR